MRKMFSSLAIINYRIWFTGSLASNIGNWMVRTAQSWLVLVILTDNSAAALGFLTAVTFIPNLILNQFGGAAADRFDKRKLLLVMQVEGAISTALVGTLVVTGNAQLWMIYLIAFIDGITITFDNPARQSMVSEIVPSHQLANAIALNSTSFNSARLIGPGIAGLLIAIVGTGQVFFIGTASYVCMFICLLLLDGKKMTPAKAQQADRGIIAGLRYVRRRPDIIVVLACGFAIGGLGFNFQISNAVMSTALYGKGAGEFGALGSIMGAGALTAALAAARRGRGRLRYVLIGMAGYTVFSALAAIKTSYLIFALLQAPIGLFTITALVTGNTLVQTASSPVMRGRMLALWNLMIMGAAPLVSPLVGWLGDALGPEWTIWFGVICVGVATLAITALVMHKDQLRFVLDHTRRWPTVRLLRNGGPSNDVDEPKDR